MKKFFVRVSAILSALTIFLTVAPSHGHQLRFVSTFLQAGRVDPDQNYLPEVDGSHSPLNRLSAVHMSPSMFREQRSNLILTRAILNLGPLLFKDHGVLVPNYQTILNEIGTTSIDGHREKILALYIADEPTGQGITRSTLETVITAVHQRFPGIPTFIVYAQDCFDNSPSLDAKCGLSGKRGIPRNLDWIGFDWYLKDASTQDETQFKIQIENTFARLKALTEKPIVLVNEGMNEFMQNLTPAQQDAVLTNRLNLFRALADQSNQIIGIDNYVWADHRENGIYIFGTRNFPSMKRALYDLAGLTINETLDGNRVLIPSKNFNGAFRVFSNGTVQTYFKGAGTEYYCSLQPTQSLEAKLTAPIFTEIRGLYNNGPCN